MALRWRLQGQSHLVKWDPVPLPWRMSGCFRRLRKTALPEEDGNATYFQQMAEASFTFSQSLQNANRKWTCLNLRLIINEVCSLSCPSFLPWQHPANLLNSQLAATHRQKATTPKYIVVNQILHHQGQPDPYQCRPCLSQPRSNLSNHTLATSSHWHPTG